MTDPQMGVTAGAEGKPIPTEKTLRDEFAMAALTGLLAAMPQGVWSDTREGMAGGYKLSAAAYMFADAMMKARKQ